MAFLAGCLSPSLQRQPEISLTKISQVIIDELGNDWEADPNQQPYFSKDTDFTSAEWGVSLGFRNKEHPLDQIYLEIHVFRNPYIATHQLFGVSPTWKYMKAPFSPDGWDYQPPHAKLFRMACEKEYLVKQRIYCTAEILYEEYIIYLQVPASSSFSLDDFKALLSTVDQYMDMYLNSSTLTPGPRIIPTLSP